MMKDEYPIFLEGPPPPKKQTQHHTHTHTHTHTGKGKLRQLKLLSAANFVHFLMFYGQQFRLAIDKHQLPPSSWLFQLEQRLLRDLGFGYALNQHVSKVEVPGRECSCEQAQFCWCIWQTQ